MADARLWSSSSRSGFSAVILPAPPTFCSSSGLYCHNRHTLIPERVLSRRIGMSKLLGRFSLPKHMVE